MDDMKQLIEKYLRGDATLQERELIKSWYEIDPAFGEWWEQELRNSGMAMDDDVQQRIYASIIHKHCEDAAPMEKNAPEQGFFPVAGSGNICGGNSRRRHLIDYP